MFARNDTEPALIGGLAVVAHQVVRATKDVDFLVEAEAADRVHDAVLVREAGVPFQPQLCIASGIDPFAEWLSLMEVVQMLCPVWPVRDRPMSSYALRLPESLKQAVKRIAAADDTTINQFLQSGDIKATHGIGRTWDFFQYQKAS